MTSTSAPAPADPGADPTKTAGHMKAIANQHKFSQDISTQLEGALRNSARIIAPTPKGPPRKPLYDSHADAIMTQFQGSWDWSKATHKWTSSSITRVLANYVYDYNIKQGFAKKVPKVKVKEETQEAAKTSAPKKVKPKSTVPKKETSLQQNPVDQGDMVEPKMLKRRITVMEQADMRFDTPLATTEQVPISQDLQSFVNWSESPFGHDMTGPAYDAFNPGGANQSATPSSYHEQHVAVDLTDIVILIKPLGKDPQNRKLLSFPLWRCQI
jgi:hypothetical protein